MVEGNGRKRVSMDELRGEFLSLVPEATVEPMSAKAEEALATRVKEIFSSLDERETRTIDLRFGLSDGEPLSQVKTGEKLGCSATTVRKIERSALNKLRHPVTSS